MPDPPQNSPIDLRAFILYHKYQSISDDKSYLNYKKLCEAMGKGAISYDEYENWLKKYIKEDERDRSIPDIRGCVLSDVINGKTAEKSINDLSDAFEACKIDKEDHDYWFKRFDSGHLFSRVTFSDFPEDVISEIVENCDIKSYFNIRNVSYGLRTVIDQLTPPCTDIKVKCEVDRIFVYLNDAFIAEYFERTKSQLPLGQIEKQSLKTLELLLSNPKLRLKSFEFVPYPYAGIDTPPQNYKQHFFDILNSLHHKIHAEKCVVRVNNEKDVIEVLQCFKPGTLKELEVDAGLSRMKVNEVVTMNQWKLAKHLKIFTFGLPSIDNFYHFSTFELGIGPICIEDMVKLCENVSISNSFEYCKVRIQKELKLETIKRVLNLQPTASPQLHSIPNTNLAIQYLYDCIVSKVFKIYKN